MSTSPGLAVSALYHQASDFVEVEVAVYNEDGELIEPGDLRTVEVALYQKTHQLQKTDALDKFFGNSDFRFRVLFSRPATTSNLEVAVTVINRDASETWRKRVPVVFAQPAVSEKEVADNAPNVMDT